MVDDGYATARCDPRRAPSAGGPLRGGKYSLFEGGTRVPFIVRWPEHVRARRVGRAGLPGGPAGQSLAALTGQKLDADGRPGQPQRPARPARRGEDGRDELVLNGNGLRQGSWVLIEAARGKKKAAAAPVQLFDLASDPGQMTNFADREPERMARMAAVLPRIRSEGRSRR